MNPFVGLVAAALHFGLSALVSAHIVLTKRDVRSAIGWVGLVWLTPVVGSALYGLLGINRIRRQATRMRRGRSLDETYTSELACARVDEALLPGATPSVHAIATLVGTTTAARLTGGNVVDPLLEGDEAYPAMIAAIDAATRSVALASYIFDHGIAGDRFIEALGRAVERGVAVRVLIDGVGARYSHPPITRALRARGVRMAHFLPSSIPLIQPYSNLRNHRKLMIVDGVVGFCGGMNIRDACLLALNPPDATRDLHFRLRGPVVGQMMTAFAFDWDFSTKEQLTGDEWFPAAPAQGAGTVVARGIADGPDEDFETLLLTLLGALSQATRCIRIVTPYFLPDPTLIDALRIAALRGVRVEIVLPERGNLRLVQWAATAQLAQVVRWGCRVYLSRPPFDHSKIMTVDGTWSLLGSANWDPRSLRLNFEYCVECYCEAFTGRLDALVDQRIGISRQVRLVELERRSIPVKLRDGVARLAQPYL